MALAGRVAIVSGSSRGIGRECVLALARAGVNVVVAAKSVSERPNLPGSIGTVAAEAEALGVEALPHQLDLRDPIQAKAVVDAAVDKWGRVDILVNNASALWWQSIEDTPMPKYDLITGINTRGAFAMTQACMPHMVRGGFGRVINMSPPITAAVGAYVNKTAYNISKMGMTMVALGGTHPAASDASKLPTSASFESPLRSRRARANTLVGSIRARSRRRGQGQGRCWP